MACVAGKYVVTGSSDQLVKVWLYNEGVPTHVGVGHAGVVTNVKVSPDGRFVVSTSVDGGIFLWRFPHDDGGGDEDGAGADPAAQVGDAREQQTARARRLSQKRAAPAREENVSAISSKTRSSQASTYSATGAGDGSAAAAATTAGGVGPAAPDVAVKCLCSRGTTCLCAGGSRKSTPHVV